MVLVFDLLNKDVRLFTDRDASLRYRMKLRDADIPYVSIYGRADDLHEFRRTYLPMQMSLPNT